MAKLDSGPRGGQAVHRSKAEGALFTSQSWAEEPVLIRTPDPRLLTGKGRRCDLDVCGFSRALCHTARRGSSPHATGSRHKTGLRFRGQTAVSVGRCWSGPALSWHRPARFTSPSVVTGPCPPCPVHREHVPKGCPHCGERASQIVTDRKCEFLVPLIGFFPLTQCFTSIFYGSASMALKGPTFKSFLLKQNVT